MMKRLSASDREMHRSRGIALARFWPFAIMLVAIIIVSTDDQMLQQCAGFEVSDRGKLFALVRMILAIPCSFYYVQGTLFNRLLLAAFWLPIPFAIAQLIWFRRHEEYWAPIRARENAHARERRASKRGKMGVKATDADSSHSD